MFQVGQTYSRKEINASIGGGMRACLLTSRGAVVGICFIPELNPQGPREILVGAGPQKERVAQLLVTQAAPVPVFAKKAPGAYEHLGSFKGAGYDAGVLKLAPAA